MGDVLRGLPREVATDLHTLPAVARAQERVGMHDEREVRRGLARVEPALVPRGGAGGHRSRRVGTAVCSQFPSRRVRDRPALPDRSVARSHRAPRRPPRSRRRGRARSRAATSCAKNGPSSGWCCWPSSGIRRAARRARGKFVVYGGAVTQKPGGAGAAARPVSPLF
ncbi:MAG: hypothetical protein MZV63_19870 [Marinilabiliales bacterium]|nr:hypothetical protein [Marinilabiliales bacterium]